MDIKLFFSPVDESIFDDIDSVSSFFKSINVNSGKMPDLAGHDIALIGVEENRGTKENEGVDQAASEIRKKLYNLKVGQEPYRIIDLGNLNPGIDLQDTYGRVKEVCEYLINLEILPVIIGGSHDISYGQYMAYEGIEKLISVLNVDAFLDMEEGAIESKSHLYKMLVHEPNYLFNYSHLAYQSYLIESTAIDVLEKLYFETYRVGQLRSMLENMEPVIREADMISFDITAIKSSDAPGNASAQPFGLTGEEACQICWYAGQNDKLSSIGFYEYNPSLDNKSLKTASVVATMIWYFIEGYYQRKAERHFKVNDYTKYVVPMDNHPETIVFFKSRLSEKWWLEVPVKNSDSYFGRNCIVPCSYSDFEVANKGEVPERYINALARLS